MDEQLHMYTNIHSHVFTRVSIYIYTYKHICKQPYIHAHILIRIHPCPFAYTGNRETIVIHVSVTFLYDKQQFACQLYVSCTR